MKLTKQKLKQIIKEELTQVLSENEEREWLNDVGHWLKSEAVPESDTRDLSADEAKYYANEIAIAEKYPTLNIDLKMVDMSMSTADLARRGLAAPDPGGTGYSERSYLYFYSPMLMKMNVDIGTKAHPEEEALVKEYVPTDMSELPQYPNFHSFKEVLDSLLALEKQAELGFSSLPAEKPSEVAPPSRYIK